jgi:hypothetical protein
VSRAKGQQALSPHTCHRCVLWATSDFTNPWAKHGLACCAWAHISNPCSPCKASIHHTLTIPADCDCPRPVGATHTHTHHTGGQGGGAAGGGLPPLLPVPGAVR